MASLVLSLVFTAMQVVSIHSSDSGTAVQIALDRTINAQEVVKGKIKEQTQTSLETDALNDCSQLFDDSIYRLNLIVKSPGCKFLDKQTWLSMAKTNAETCIAGFNELGLSGHPVTPVAEDISKSLSNALDVVQQETNNDGVFNQAMFSSATQPLTTDLNVNFLTTDLKPSFVVAQDGSGQGRFIKDAITAAGNRATSSKRFVIYVKEGVYDERIEIFKDLPNIIIFGDGIGKTIVTGDRHASKSTTTSQSATFVVRGDRFIAKDMTFRNTASKSQAVALRSASDHAIFYRCSFEGYQDTLYAHSGRQFYRECDISGTIDFIFGNAAAVLQNCNIYARKPHGNYIVFTAQGRSNPNENTGIVIQNSTITSEEKIKSKVRVYLGRPWKEYSRVVVMGSSLDGFIDPEGWLKWDAETDVSKVYYAEFNNTGPGSFTEKRVNWEGYHAIANVAEALSFTIKKFFLGDLWLSSTNVPYNDGL